MNFNQQNLYFCIVQNENVCREILSPECMVFNIHIQCTSSIVESVLFSKSY